MVVYITLGERTEAMICQDLSLSTQKRSAPANQSVFLTERMREM